MSLMTEQEKDALFADLDRIGKDTKDAYEDPGPDAVCQVCGDPSPYLQVHGECYADLVGL